MVKTKVNIKQIFGGLQNQMKAKLSLNRKVIKHPTSKGDASELEWIDMFRSYLPEGYCVLHLSCIRTELYIVRQNPFMP